MSACGWADGLQDGSRGRVTRRSAFRNSSAKSDGNGTPILPCFLESVKT